MKDFKDKVAVITGAASGIGRGLAERCVQEGMKVVLADIEENALALTEREMSEAGASILAVPTDVSDINDIEALAQKTLDAFAAVHLLCNNAGVTTGGSVWESTLADWQWVIGVNLWGVIHSIHVFIPIMLEQGTECHIVNTASVAGLTTSPRLGVYSVTKHGILALSEILYHELGLIDANIKVSVLCPGFINTRLLVAERNRPTTLKNDPTEEQRKSMSPVPQTVEQIIMQELMKGMPPEQVADSVFNAIKEGKFYILPNVAPFRQTMQTRMEDILQERNPTYIDPQSWVT